MSDPSIKAKNPLTIIAIFAGIIEASAMASLPLLDEDSQDIYTWFLVGFPPFLTLLFFLTLNFNYKSLYSPSDFSNETDFLKVMDKSSALLAAPTDTGEKPLEQPTLTTTVSAPTVAGSSLSTAQEQPTETRQPRKRRRQGRHQAMQQHRPTADPSERSGHQTIYLRNCFKALHIIDGKLLKDKIHLASILSSLLKRPNTSSLQNPFDTHELLMVLTNEQSESFVDELLIDTLRSDGHKTNLNCTWVTYNLDTLSLTTITKQNPDTHTYSPP